MIEQIFESLRGLPLGRHIINAKDKERVDRFIKCVCGECSISQAIHYYYGRYIAIMMTLHLILLRGFYIIYRGIG